MPEIRYYSSDIVQNLVSDLQDLANYFRPCLHSTGVTSNHSLTQNTKYNLKLSFMEFFAWADGRWQMANVLPFIPFCCQKFNIAAFFPLCVWKYFFIRWPTYRRQTRQVSRSPEGNKTCWQYSEWFTSDFRLQTSSSSSLIGDNCLECCFSNKLRKYWWHKTILLNSLSEFSRPTLH